MNTFALAPSAASVVDLSVLVVDDDPFQQALIKETLRQIGVRQVAVSGDARQALMTLGAKDDHTDVLICDLHMPGMDGFELMQAVAAIRPGLQVLVLSGQRRAVLNSATLVAQLHQSRLLGALEKPAEPQQLRRVLAQATMARAA